LLTIIIRSADNACGMMPKTNRRRFSFLWQWQYSRLYSIVIIVYYAIGWTQYIYTKYIEIEIKSYNEIACGCETAPSGVCVPPQFNAEAETREDCLTCFCFEHTSDCYSSDLFISEANTLLVAV